MKTMRSHGNCQKSGIFFVFILLFLVMITWSNISHAASVPLYVNGTSGDDNYDGTSPNWVSGIVGPKKTIQNATDAVEIEGTVHVASGTYNEHITIGKSLSLVGANPETTIINGTNNGRVIYITSSVNVNIINFTICNGLDDYGGAIFKSIFSSLNITNCNITNNTGSFCGGIYNEISGTVNINDSILSENSGTSTDDKETVGGAIYNIGTLNINDSILSGNYAPFIPPGEGGSSGGAISNAGAMTITNTTITGNNYYAINNYSSGTITIHGSTLNNSNSIYNEGDGAVTIRESNLIGDESGFILSNTGYLTMNYNRVITNFIAIWTETDVDATYNWWGSNSEPDADLFEGPVFFDYWLCMTLNASPTLILNGATSTLTASFNNVWDGLTVTPIDPAIGHLPDGSLVTFTTDWGNVGSKTTTKNTSNGIATATLTANDGIGTAHVTAQLDSQIINSIVGIETLYVNGATGNDAWDGLSPTFISGNTGPMKTIQTALNAIDTVCTVYVASGTYNEHLSIAKNLNLIGSGQNLTFINGTNNGRVITIINSANVKINGFTIQNGNSTDGGGAIRLTDGDVNIANCTLTGNNAIYGGAIYNTDTLTITNSTITGNNANTLSGGAIYNSGTLNITNSTITGNSAKNNGGALYNTGTATLQFNRIVNNSPNAIYTTTGVDAQYNWWGSNSDPSSAVSASVDVTPWLVLTVNSNPSLIPKEGTSTVTADLNHDSSGSIVTGNLMDGIPIKFNCTAGTINSPRSTVNGVATTTFKGVNVCTISWITASLDNQDKSIPITIATKITPNSQDQLNPAIYGNLVVWQDNRYGNWEIMMKDLNTNTESRVTTNSKNQTNPSIYGNLVVWQDNRYGNWEIMMKDLTTNIESRVTTNSHNQMDPSIYGNLVVWQDDRYGNWEIMMKNLTTNTESRVTTNSKNQTNPAIYGEKVVWQDNRYGNWEIMMKNLTSNIESRVTLNSHNQTNPAIYEDKVVWQDDRYGNNEIMMKNLTTSTESRITNNIKDQNTPAIYQNKIVWECEKDIYLWN